MQKMLREKSYRRNKNIGGMKYIWFEGSTLTLTLAFIYGYSESPSRRRHYSGGGIKCHLRLQKRETSKIHNNAISKQVLISHLI